MQLEKQYTYMQYTYMDATRKAVHVQRNIEARSSNHCCSEKAMC